MLLLESRNNLIVPYDLNVALGLPYDLNVSFVIPQHINWRHILFPAVKYTINMRRTEPGFNPGGTK